MRTSGKDRPAPGQCLGPAENVIMRQRGPTRLTEVHPFDDVAVVAERLRSLVLGVAGRAFERVAVVGRGMWELVEGIGLRRDLVHRAVAADAGFVGRT